MQHNYYWVYCEIKSINEKIVHTFLTGTCAPPSVKFKTFPQTLYLNKIGDSVVIVCVIT